MMLHLLIYLLLGAALYVPLHVLLRRLGFFASPARYLRPYVPPEQRAATTSRTVDTE